MSVMERKEQVASMEQTFSLPHGRQLGYCSVGEGKPVLYFHGTASSRLETLLLKELASSAKLQIIGVDRPGYGLSTYAHRKSLGDFAHDLHLLAEHLHLDEAAVLGWSGGGVFALVYVALFPEQVTHAVVVGAPALPFDVSTAHNNPLARYAMKVPYVGMLALRRMRSQVLKANADIDAFLGSKEWKSMLNGFSKDDVKVFSDRAWLTSMYGSMAEAFRQGDSGVKAVFEEHQLFTKTWDVPLSRIPSGKVFVWQGAEDKTCRVDNAYRIAKQVPGARLEVFEGKGHCFMFDYLDKLGETLRR
jgi:pimeloyl-ACP methyl ester carboxylesterase